MSFLYLLILTYVNVPFYPKENAYGTEYTIRSYSTQLYVLAR